MKCILYLPQIWKRGSETKQAGKKATWIKANGSAPQISQKSPCIGLVLPLPKLCIFSLINKKSDWEMTFGPTLAESINVESSLFH